MNDDPVWSPMPRYNERDYEETAWTLKAWAKVWAHEVSADAYDALVHTFVRLYLYYDANFDRNKFLEACAL